MIVARRACRNPPVFERKFQRGAIGELTALFTKQFFPGRMAFGHRRRRFDSTPRDLRRIDQRVARPRVQIDANHVAGAQPRSEEHTSELQSLMRISYAVFCLKKKKIKNYNKRVD